MFDLNCGQNRRPKTVANWSFRRFGDVFGFLDKIVAENCCRLIVPLFWLRFRTSGQNCRPKTVADWSFWCFGDVFGLLDTVVAKKLLPNDRFGVLMTFSDFWAKMLTENCCRMIVLALWRCFRISGQNCCPKTVADWSFCCFDDVFGLLGKIVARKLLPIDRPVALRTKWIHVTYL